MKTKLIYTALACLTMTCSIANASYITNGKDEDKRLGSYTGGSSGNVGSFKGASSSASSKVNFDNINFNDASQLRGKKDLQIGDDLLRVNLEILHIGENATVPANLKQDLMTYISNWKPGMASIEAKKIADTNITERDNKKMSDFAKLVEKGLCVSFASNLNVTEDLRTFKNRLREGADCGLQVFDYADNCLMFSLLNFFDAHSTSIEISDKTGVISGYIFKFSRCTDKEAGVDMHFRFDPIFSRDIDKKSPDTLNDCLQNKHYLTKKWQYYPANYTISMFKVDTDTYRVNAKLSSKQNHKDEEQNPYDIFKDRKITNFLLEIK